MAITVDFYTNKSDNRCLTKVLEPTQNGQDLSCDIYDPCDRLNPILVVDTTKVNLINTNYCEIPEFGRKYFITNIVGKAGRKVEVHCHVDVLGTYDEQLRNCPLIAARSTNQDTAIAAAQSEADAVANAGAKNYVKYNMTVPSELSAVVNSDGSITVTASTTSIRRLTIATDLTKLISGNRYILSGCTGGNPSTTYHLGITKSNYAGVVYQTNAEVQFTKSDEMALLVLTVQAGQNWTKTFYPMIRRAEIADNTFQPYAPTNRELYEMILALQGGTS